MGDHGLGDALRVKREQCNLSARSLSASLGKSPSYMSKVESGDITLSLTAFAEIANALELTVPEILWILKEAGRQATVKS